MQVTEEIEGTRFNTGISAMMEFLNAAYKVVFYSVLSVHSVHILLRVNYQKYIPNFDENTKSKPNFVNSAINKLT